MRTQRIEWQFYIALKIIWYFFDCTYFIALGDNAVCWSQVDRHVISRNVHRFVWCDATDQGFNAATLENGIETRILVDILTLSGKEHIISLVEKIISLLDSKRSWYSILIGVIVSSPTVCIASLINEGYQLEYKSHLQPQTNHLYTLWSEFHCFHLHSYTSNFTLIRAVEVTCLVDGHLWGQFLDF